MELNKIRDSAAALLEELPDGVTLVAAAKTRTPEQVAAALEAGVSHIGHNYVQEAEEMKPFLQNPVTWHLIGHLQRNKARKSVSVFNVIETVDSIRLANAIDRACADTGQTMPVLIEFNSADESSKAGANSDKSIEIAQHISQLSNISLCGIMTMGPFSENPEVTRPYFTAARKLFEQIDRMDLSGTEMKWLSMGMSSSYRTAIEEGANIIRVGTRIFGER